MGSQIVQIIPAPSNLFSVQKNIDEGENKGKEFESKVICVALTNDGEVILLDLSMDGLIDQMTTVDNFKRVIWK